MRTRLLDPTPVAIVIVATAVAITSGAPALRAGARPQRPVAPVAQRRPAPVTVPISYEDARVYVPVRIGAAARWLILDTGAQPTVLDWATARAAGVATEDAGTTTGAGGGTTAVAGGSGVVVRIGPVAVGPLNVRVAPLDSLLGPSSGRAVQGILGSRLFLEHVVELDFDRSELRLHDPATYRYAGRGAVVPLELDHDVPFARAWLTTPDGRRLPMRVLVDLGAKSTLLLTEPFVRTGDLRRAFPRATESPLGAGMGGPTRYAFARAPLLELDTARAARLPAAIVGLSVGGTLRSAAYDGLLGAEYLARFRVIFDYARRRLILEPRDPAPAATEFDMSGMFLVTTDPARRRVEVRDVREGSPAAQAGVRPGDLIEAIDGRPTRQLTLADVRQRLRGPDGRAVALTLRRDAAIARVTFGLRRAL